MADSPALRNRRARAHRNGNHSLCVESRCSALRMPSGDNGRGSVLEAWDQWAATVHYAADDPRRVLLACGRELADMVERRQGMPAAVRQLTQVLNHCIMLDDSPASWFDEFTARATKRKFELLVNEVNNEMRPAVAR